MSINKWLLFLLYIIGVCVACTEEDVVLRKEGKITIVPVWENYTGSFRPSGIRYYFYKMYDHSDYPVMVEDSTGEGIINQVLPVGVYQLVGYNMDTSNNLNFDTTKNLTVVAKFSSYPYPDNVIPLNLCIISSEYILIRDKNVITEKIIPVEVNTKSLELIFRPGKNITVDKIRGTLDGAFASINLLNGEAFEDEGDIFFDVPDTRKIKFQISDVYSSSKENTNTDNVYSYSYPSLNRSMLSLTLEVSEKDSDNKTVIKTKTGEFDLINIIREIYTSKIPNDNITLYVDINNENLEGRVKINVTLFRDY